MEKKKKITCNSHGGLQGGQRIRYIKIWRVFYSYSYFYLVYSAEVRRNLKSSFVLRLPPPLHLFLYFISFFINVSLFFFSLVVLPVLFGKRYRQSVREFLMALLELENVRHEFLEKCRAFSSLFFRILSMKSENNKLASRSNNNS